MLRQTLVAVSAALVALFAASAAISQQAPGQSSSPKVEALPKTKLGPRGTGQQFPSKAVPEGKVMLNARDTMRWIVNPAAELYWKHSGEVVDENGLQNRAPKEGEIDVWQQMVQAAATLQESGNLLMMDGRARDEPWMRYAQQLSEAGAKAIKAAEAKDMEKAFDAGSALYDSCFNCHGRYIARPANSLYDAPLYHEDPDHPVETRSPYSTPK